MKLGNYYITVKRKSALIYPMLVFFYTILYLLFNKRPFWGEDLLLVRLILLCIFVSLPFVIKDEIKISLKKHQDNIKQEKTMEKSDVIRVLGLILSVSIYLFTLNKLGFVISSYILMLFLMYFLQEKNWKVLILVPFVVTLLIYLMFKVWLLIPLPQGIFGF